jgi:23S rRNA (uracil-5-)-methyltransferase rumA
MKNRKSGDAGIKYDPAQVRIHEAYTVAIRDLGVHGEGIGSVDGFTVFVPGALPGETVTAKITLLKKSYALGKLLSIEQESPFRMVPECPVYEHCGGCQLSHLTYEGQLDMKYRRVKDVIERIAGESGDLVKPVLPAAHLFAYRNKMAVPAGLVKRKAALGCYRQGSHDIIPVSSCAIQKKENNRLLQFARWFIEKYGISVYDEKTRKGSLRRVMGRVGDDGKVMVVLVTASETLPEEKRWIEEIQKELPEAVSLWHNIQPKPGNTILGAKIRHLWSRETLTASLCGLRFEVSPYSFFQVHKEQAEILYEKALAYADLKGGETVIDAYCGTGTISLCLAKKAKRVIGIEIVKSAIEDAKKNAKMNHMENTEFYAADAGKFMPQLYRKGLVPDVIVMDPVRAGCSEEVLKAAAGMNPKRIVYVSCNPATFARDAKILKSEGYEIKEVEPVDMFPQTMHVETVCLLVLRNPVTHINIDVDVEELVQDKRGRATYGQIQEYVKEHTGLNVTNLNVTQTKRKCGIIERENYNLPKLEDSK